MSQMQQPSAPQSPQQQVPTSPQGVPGYQDPPQQAQQSPQPRDQFALKFQQLQEREKQLRSLEQQLKERGDRVSSLESAFSRANDDPFGLLQELNLDVERLYEVKKGGGKFAPGEMQVRQLKSELDKLREQVAAKERAEQEAAQRRAQEEALANFKQNVSKSLQESEKYELSKARGGVDDVLDVIAKHFSETSEVLEIDQALEMVEKRYEEEAQKLLKTNKIKQLFAQLNNDSSQQGAQSSQQYASQGSQVRTLTNAMTANTAPAGGDGLTPAQRLQRAIAIMERGSA